MRSDRLILSLAALTVPAALAVWAGWLTGGRGGLAVLLLTTTLLLATAWRLVVRYSDDPRWDVRVMDTVVVALAIIVVLGLVLGTLGLLHLHVLMLAVVVVGLVGGPHPLPLSPAGARGASTQHSFTDPEVPGTIHPSPAHGRGEGGEGLSSGGLSWSLADVRWYHAVLSGLIAFGIAQVVRDRGLLPPVGDAIGYHLPFVGEWVQSGTLAMPVPAAGDPSPPFYPLNSSLWMFWTAAPFESDVLARFVQAPFFVLLFLAVARLGLEIGLRSGGALTAGLLTLSLPDVIRGLALAENDVILAALLVTVTANLALLWNRPTVWRAAAGAGVIGLAIGTKVLAVPFAGVLGLAWLAIVFYRWRSAGWKRFVTLALLAAAIVVLLGGYSYIRNAVVMSNPSYPVRTEFGGEELLPGLYAATREWKESHPFYPFDWGGFFAFGMRGFFGWTIPLLILPGLALAALRSLRERRVLPVVVALWSGVSLAIFWFVLPYHFERFLYATLAWAIVVAAWGWLGVLRSEALLGLLVIPLALVNVSSLPIDSDVWRNPTYIVAAVVIVLGTAAAVMLVRLLRGLLKVPLVAPVTIALALLLVLVWPVYGDRYAEQRFDQWGRLSAFLGSQPETWRWLWNETRDSPATIAVAGTNSTFPLYGPSLQNRVVTISHDGNLQHYDWGKPFIPFGEPDRDAWLRSIDAAGVDYLWITANVSFGGWPAEDEWASSSPNFEPIIMEDDLHVWRVVPE